MKCKKLLFCTTLMSVMVTSCGQAPATYNGPNKYHNLPSISQQRAEELINEMINQLENKSLMATISVKKTYETKDEKIESYFSGDYSGHLDTRPYSYGYKFEYIQGSYEDYPHDSDVDEDQLNYYENQIGYGFVSFLGTFPSRVSPRFEYKYYYDNTYLYLFAEGHTEGVNADYYYGTKIDKIGITCEYFRINDNHDSGEKITEEFNVNYYEEN